MSDLERDDRAPLPPPGTPITAYLDQETWWRGQDGRPYLVTSMSQEHRVNLLAYLRRNATRLREHARWVELSVAAADDALFDVARSVLLDRSDLDWLNDRPLVRALGRAVARHDALDGEVVPDATSWPGRRELEEGGP